MRMTALFCTTLREVPAEAEVVSHQLLLRGGYIRKLAAGIYSLLPLGFRVIHNVEQIVREEMNRAGAQELRMPALQPAELWQETGRWDIYGKELMRLTDRHERLFCLGPTHEEVITDLVRHTVKSYRQLPLNLYQIQTKFRDEIRPRFGLMRGREFGMKDAYSFDRDEAGLDKSYQAMYQAYCRIFERCGLDIRVVNADPGAIGGNASQEFMVLAETGEEPIAICDQCDYAASLETAVSKSVSLDQKIFGGNGDATPVPSPQQVNTPNLKSVEEVAQFFKVPPEQLIKTLLYEADGNVVAALVQGTNNVSEFKLQRLLGCRTLTLATPALIEQVTDAPCGFSGPVGLKGIKMVADPRVMAMSEAIVGANVKDAHLSHVVPRRDFEVEVVADIGEVGTGDACSQCMNGKLKVLRGIEVGHIFKLGTKYSEAMGATYLDEAGVSRPIVMGCYGIGIGRTAQAAIEQCHDANGISWPVGLAPYQVVVVPANTSEPSQMAYAESLYQALGEAGASVLLDDRDERAGVKFKDADLIGFPLRVVVGKKFSEGKIELKWRTDEKPTEVAIEDVVPHVTMLLNRARQSRPASRKASMAGEKI